MGKNIGVVEKKVLGALLIMANDDLVATCTMREIAERMGYEKTGGIITYALKLLEMNNYIVKIADRKYKILL